MRSGAVNAATLVVHMTTSSPSERGSKVNKDVCTRCANHACVRFTFEVTRPGSRRNAISAVAPRGVRFGPSLVRVRTRFSAAEGRGTVRDEPAVAECELSYKVV